MIKKFTTLFPESMFASHLTGKILSFEFYPKAVFSLSASLGFMVRHYSRSKLTDWTSEGWIEKKDDVKDSLA